MKNSKSINHFGKNMKTVNLTRIKGGTGKKKTVVDQIKGMATTNATATEYIILL